MNAECHGPLVLPALLTVLGPRIETGRMPWRRGSRVHAPAHRQVARGDLTHAHGAWANLAHSVMRRPVAYVLVIVVALMALGAPLLSARRGSADERVLPVSAPSRVAADLGTREFGGETASANIVVQGAVRSQVDAYVKRLGSVSGVQSARSIDQVTSGAGATSLVQVSWLGNSQTVRSQQPVKDLRAVDLIDSIGGRLPWMGVFVVAVMPVLLFLAFGSLVLPLKAVVMAAVSLGASFGVVTWDLPGRSSVRAVGLRLMGLSGRHPTDPDARHHPRPVHGLRGVLALPDPRGVGSHRRQRDSCGQRTAAQRAHHHQRGAVAGRGDRRVRHVRHRADEDDRDSHARRSPARCHRRAGTAGAGHDAAARQRELVAPGPMRRWWGRHGMRESETVGVARTEAELVSLR